MFVVPAANQNPRLRWWQWFQLGNSYNGTDVGDFEISTNNGASWQTLLSIGGEGAASGGWTEPSVDLSAYAGQSVKIAFYYQTGDEYHSRGPGWFVDNVTLVTGAVTTLTPNVPVGFESGLGDWSVDNGLWAVGVPTAGPGAAYDGTNCSGTGLSGNVPTFVGSSLISPVFVVPGANQNPRLRWWQWFHLGNSYNGTDLGDFQISTNNGTSWQTLLSIGGENAASGGWTEPSVDLSAYAGQSVQIAFYYQTGDEYHSGGPGWFVDDVTLVTLTTGSSPFVTTQPLSQAVLVGSNVTFTVIASGAQPLSYQWQFNNVNLVDNNRISGSLNTNLFIADVAANDGGDYQVVVTNAYGSTTSTVAVLTVLKAIPMLTWTTPTAITYGTPSAQIS